MNALRLRPFMYFAMGIAVTAVAAWSLSAWRASAAVSADESTFVAVSPTRILDTREDIGLAGPFVSPVAQDLKVTGTIATKSGTIVVVPDGATGVILNVTVVGPTAAGFVSIRPADAPGVPTTSSLNFNAGDVIPNSVTVQMPTSGGDAGKIEITYDAFGQGRPDHRDAHRRRRLHQERRPRQPPSRGRTPSRPRSRHSTPPLARWCSTATRQAAA